MTTADVAVDEQTDRVFASGLPYSGPGTLVLLDGRSGAVQYSIVVGGQDAWGWGGDWVRRFSAAMRPFATGGVYLNLEADEGEDKVRANFSAEKYAKLAALKARWDPQNLFRLNQNIRPRG